MKAFRTRAWWMLKRKNLLKLIVLALVFVLLSFILNGAKYMILIILAAVIHEAGHIFAAKVLGVPMMSDKALIFGLSLRFDFSAVSYFKEFAVGIAGALFNVCACFAALAFVKNPGYDFAFFVFSNVSLAIFNLVPVSPLDGSGILFSLLSMIVREDTAFRCVRVISSVFAFAFFLLSVYIQMKVGANLSLMLISAALIYYSVREGKKV